MILLLAVLPGLVASLTDVFVVLTLELVPFRDWSGSYGACCAGIAPARRPNLS